MGKRGRRFATALPWPVIVAMLVSFGAQSASVSVRPVLAAGSVSASPASGPSGSTTTLSGSGWTPSPTNPAYRLFWDSVGGPNLGSFSPGANGSWQAPVTIPANAQTGSHLIFACEGVGGEFQSCASTPFNVTGGPTPIPSPTPRPTPTFQPTTTPVPGAPTTTTTPGGDECVPRGIAGEVVINFDGPEFVLGAPIDRARVFAGGTRFVGDHSPMVIDPAVRTQSEPRALIHDFAGSEFGSTSAPLRIRFNGLKDFVGLYVGVNERLFATEPFTARLTAYRLDPDSGLAVVATDTARLGPAATPITTCLAVSAPGRIIEVTVDYGGVYEPEIIDSLIIRGPAEEVIPRDDRPPVVTIQRPTEGARIIDETGVRLDGTVFEDRELAAMSYAVNGGTPIDLGFARTGPTEYFFLVDPVRPADGLVVGENTIEVVARDAAGNVGRATVHFTWGQPARVDTWIMGIEYNQLWQDVVYTDLNRGPIIGFIPLLDPSGRDSEFAIPIQPGKPMVVRVYVGLRDTPTPPPGGVRVSGRLLVDTAIVGDPATGLTPLETPNCFDHLGTPYPCQSTIRVFPSFGDMGLNTSNSYDLDLISQRSSWSETLNFVIPGSVTGKAPDARGLVIRASIFPVDEVEVERGDNEFELQLQNVAEPRSVDVRLVRVGVAGIPAPTRAAADRALADLLRMTPWDRVNVISDDLFESAGARYSIEVGVIDVRDLDQCASLWFDLFDRFGLDESNTLLAFTPPGIGLDNCAGMGWKVIVEGTSAGAGTGTSLGGIAFAEIPPYAGATNSAADWGAMEVVAQEIYHAALDRRHVSNDHGEDSGCFLDSGLADVLSFILSVDTDCHKGSVHPHGAIGAYPATVVEIGRPGEIPGILSGRIFGRLGGMGARIEPEGDSFRLTLYDPCPTGPLNRADPLSTMAQRIDLDTGRNTCSGPGDGAMAHDFMSYGPNRWYSIQLLPNVKTLAD
jgi:hypothetical protein